MIETTNSKLVEELNDLVQIQNDRIKGYQNAQEELKDKDDDLRRVFSNMIDTSKQHKNELSRQIVELGGETTEGTTVSGKLYRVWMDIKSTVTGHNRETILESCKFGEEAAQKVYDMALASDAAMTPGLRSLLVAQQGELKAALNEVSRLEELAEKAD
jgi:uncharacterized protein (TIGR02284 family)